MPRFHQARGSSMREIADDFIGANLAAIRVLEQSAGNLPLIGRLYVEIAEVFAYIQSMSNDTLPQDPTARAQRMPACLEHYATRSAGVQWP